MILHHPRKKASAEGCSARGSGALLGFVDIILEMQLLGRLKCDETRRRLVSLSRHRTTPKQLTYQWTPGTPDFRIVDDPNRTRYLENWETLQAILKRRDRASSAADLLTDWPPDREAPSRSSLYQWLMRAADEGKVSRSGFGTKKEPYRFLVPSKANNGLPPLPKLGG
jgi:hypothetical protein